MLSFAFFYPCTVSSSISSFSLCFFFLVFRWLNSRPKRVEFHLSGPIAHCTHSKKISNGKDKGSSFSPPKKGFGWRGRAKGHIFMSRQRAREEAESSTNLEHISLNPAFSLHNFSTPKVKMKAIFPAFLPGFFVCLFLGYSKWALASRN